MIMVSKSKTYFSFFIFLSLTVTFLPVFAENLPSNTPNQRWIRVFSENDDQSRINFTRVGKWIINYDNLPNVILSPEDNAAWEQYDLAWTKIRDAVKKGKLGFSAKTSTIRPSKYPGEVLIVYTNDFMNREDMCRVYRSLTELGFNQELEYKTDNMTFANIYDKVFGTSSEFCPEGS